MKTIAIVYGTRPEAIKVAPLIRALREEPGIRTLVISAGQHREMLRSVEEIFALAPDVSLDVMRPGQHLTELFGRIGRALDPVLVEHAPDLLVVHGDTTTAASAALAAFHREIPIAHLEAGLRSGDLSRPFPEEGNRRLIARIARLHLAPTTRARHNLDAEAVPADEIVVTGNTVIDALQWAAVRADAAPWPDELRALDSLGSETRTILVTLHRRENQGGAIAEICGTLAEYARTHPDVQLVFPMHRNPVVREAVREALAGTANALLIEPVDYTTMVKLLRRSWLVVTDSGGIQEEAPAFGVPVLVARDTTERPEAVEAGVARLVGGDGAALSAALRALTDDGESWQRMARSINPFGDGHAAERAVHAIRSVLRMTQEAPVPA